MAKQQKNAPGTRFPKRGRPRTKSAAPLGIQTVEASFHILEHVIASEGGIGLSSLSRLTGLQPNKLHRYVVSLIKCGMLMQMPITGLYHLGPAARRLGMAALTRFDEMGAIQEQVKRFAAETGWTICQYVWTELGPTLINVEYGTFSFPIMFRLGAAIPLCTSATGRFYLAMLPETATADLVKRERTRAERLGYKIPQSAALERELEKVRSNTIYLSNEAVIVGICIVGPIYDSHGHLFSTLSALAPPNFDMAKDGADFVRSFEQLVEKLSLEVFGYSPARRLSRQKVRPALVASAPQT